MPTCYARCECKCVLDMATDTYLRHLERHDLRVRTLAARHVAVVRAQDLMARRVAALHKAAMRVCEREAT